MALLEIRNLKKYFPVHGRLLGRGREYVKAIDGVSLDVDEGETVGLVGESGCGKTSLGRCLVRLIEPSGGHRYLRRAGAILPVWVGHARGAPQDADDLSGSLCVAQSAHASRRNHRRGIAHSRPGQGPRSQVAGAGAADTGRTARRNISADILTNSRADNASASASLARSP